MSDTIRHASEGTQERRISQYHKRAARASRNRSRRVAALRASDIDSTRFGVLMTDRLAEKAWKVRA